MKNSDINIRDPYVLVHEGKYYLYGTRSETCWGPADGFDCYVSDDMENWEGPVEIFHRPEGFWADRFYWAPECVYHGGKFCLVTTLGSEDRKKGIYVLKSDSPTGPFEPASECLTPADWTCIDGTVFFEDGVPYLIFSHSFEDDPKGDMCILPLSDDLCSATGEVTTIFSAGEAPWANPVPFAKAEFGMDGDVYFTDGPCLVKMEKGLYMTWSSWGTNGYAVGIAVSESCRLAGPWKQLAKPLYPENGGHGMVFTDVNGQLYFTLHTPNDKYMERPVFMKMKEEDGTLVLE